MAQKQFGSTISTGTKLEIIEQYLNMYQKSVGVQFYTRYIDAFAGSGEVPLSRLERGFLDDLVADESVVSVLKGSASRALDIRPSFNEYYFIEKDEKCIQALQAKFEGHSEFPRAVFLNGDSNVELARICDRKNWKGGKRGVVLLDPFGSQVDWSTLELIAETKCLDLWYLFPAGLSVFRQISNNGKVHHTHETSLDRMLGTNMWREAFLKPSLQSDLFGQHTANEKVVTPESAADFMITRLKSIFKGGVLNEKIPLGKHSYPSYYLLFAWGNESAAAKTLANKLSKAALKATERRHGRPIGN